MYNRICDVLVAEWITVNDNWTICMRIRDTLYSIVVQNNGNNNTELK